jgi:phage I-like protein
MKFESICLSEITLSEKGKAPSEFRILGKGETPTRKDGIVVVFEEEDATLVLAEQAKDPRRLPLDYDHSTEDRGVAPTDRKAAGSFGPAVRAGELWATEVEWTVNGRAAVEAKEFLYTSLSGEGKRQGNKWRLTRLRSVAVTNTPATIGAEPLVASEGVPSEEVMAVEAKQENVVTLALGLTDDAEAVTLAGDLRAVFSEAAEVTGKAKAGEIRGALQALRLSAARAEELEAKLSEFAAAKEKTEREALIQRLSDEKKLPATMHDWARKAPMDVLLSFSEVAPSYAGPADVQSPSAEQVADPELAKLLGRLGITEDEHRAALKSGSV